jgi:hypothetical protein
MVTPDTGHGDPRTRIPAGGVGEDHRPQRRRREARVGGGAHTARVDETPVLGAEEPVFRPQIDWLLLDLPAFYADSEIVIGHIVLAGATLTAFHVDPEEFFVWK